VVRRLFFKRVGGSVRRFERHSGCGARDPP
jgi:hypothetical protein